jgi:hypothetical protein
VPFCAGVRSATGTVLSPRSVLGRRREIADSACADIRRRYQSLRSLTVALFPGDAHPVTSLFAKVACAPNGTLMTLIVVPSKRLALPWRKGSNFVSQ